MKVNYLDARSPEERAKEPTGILTASGTTHNTREGIEDSFMKFIEPALNNGFDDGYRGADPDKAQKAYRDRYAWALDIRDFFKKQFHQELQKARESELNRILHIALTMGDCPINNPEADAGWMKFQHDFCIKLTKDNKKSILSESDQSELDQPLPVNK